MWVFFKVHSVVLMCHTGSSRQTGKTAASTLVFKSKHVISQCDQIRSALRVIVSGCLHHADDLYFVGRRDL